MKTVFVFPVCLLIAVSFTSTAQTEFRPGVIFLSEKDSVQGMIGYTGDIGNTLTCISRDAEGKIKEYKPYEIYGYHFLNGKFYVSKNVKTGGSIKPFFVEYLVKGKKNLFCRRDNTGNHFLIDAGRDTVAEVIFKERTIIEGDQEYALDINIHQGYLKAYFSDCPRLDKDIAAIHKPDYSNMISLTKKYHHLTCGDSGCIVYYRKPYRFRMSVEFRYSAVKYFETTGEFVPQYAGLAHFWLPRSSERMYIATGFAWSPLRVDGVPYNIYKIPMWFEYVWPYKVIRPKITGGVNFMFITENKNQSGIGIDWPVMAGVMICPSDIIALDLSLEGDFFPFIDVQDFQIKRMVSSWSLNTGILLRF